MAQHIFSRVLVTGGAGFIGSHLLEAIRARAPEARVTVIDNFLTGSQRNLDAVKWEGLEFVQHDLTEYAWLDSWLHAQEIDPFTLILHFASPASPPRYQAEPIRTYLVNSQVTHQLAQYASRTEARLLFASTSEVYGDPDRHPQAEDYWGNVNPNGVRSCYDEAKRLGETVCGVHFRHLGVDTRLVRIFNTYGPRMDLYDGRVIPSFCLSAMQGEPLQMFGDGSQTRSFCFVTDLVEGLLRYSERDGLAGETINLGNPGEYSMLELAMELEKIVGHPLGINRGPLPADDPRRRRPDISKAMRLLDWQPTISLPEGLARTWQSFQREV